MSITRRELYDEPPPSHVVRPVLLAFSAFVVLFFTLVGLTLFQIDEFSDDYAASLASALSRTQLSGNPQALVDALQNNGIPGAHLVSSDRATAGEIVVPVYAATGLRMGFVAFEPPHPARTIFARTAYFKLPIFLTGAAVLVGFIIHFGQKAQDAIARRNQARHLAFIDELSGLPNRRVFDTSLQECLEDVSDGRATCFALCFIDIDGLKHINTAHGHAVGDELIRAVSGRLRDFVGADELAVRLSSDEFAVIRRQPGSNENARAYGHALVQLLALPHAIDGTIITSSASVGVAYVTGAEVPSFTTLCSLADHALHAAKTNGGNCEHLVCTADEIRLDKTSI